MTTAPRPTATGRPSPSRRTAWALATVVAVLAVGVLLFALRNDSGQVAEPTTVPTTTTVPTSAANPTVLTQEEYEPIGPGTYFIDADGDLATTAGTTVIIRSFIPLIEVVGGGDSDWMWIGSRHGVNFNEGNAILDSLHLHPFKKPYTPGCHSTYEGAAGLTAAEMAEAVATSGLTVLEAPARISAFGRDGHHVVVEVPEGCEYGGEGTPHVSMRPGYVLEAWFFDIEAEVVMVEAMWRGSSPGINQGSAKGLGELRAVIDSLVLVP